MLELGEVRSQLLPGRRAAETEREILHRALAYAAKLLTEAGTAVIIDAAAPRRAWRQAARELIPCFAEIYLVCPTEVGSTASEPCVGPGRHVHGTPTPGR